MRPQEQPDRPCKPRFGISEVSVMRAGFHAWLLRLASQPAADLLAYERHRVNNHMQVLGGWVSLGRLEKAREYLERIAEAERTRSAVLQALPAWAQVDLVALWELAERAGVTLEVDVQSIWSPKPGLFSLLRRLVEAAQARREPVTLAVRVRGPEYRIEVSGPGMRHLIGQAPGPWEVSAETALLTRRMPEGVRDVR